MIKNGDKITCKLVINNQDKSIGRNKIRFYLTKPLANFGVKTNIIASRTPANNKTFFRGTVDFHSIDIHHINSLDRSEYLNGIQFGDNQATRDAFLTVGELTTIKNPLLSYEKNTSNDGVTYSIKINNSQGYNKVFSGDYFILDEDETLEIEYTLIVNQDEVNVNEANLWPEIKANYNMTIGRNEFFKYKRSSARPIYVKPTLTTDVTQPLFFRSI